MVNYLHKYILYWTLCTVWSNPACDAHRWRSRLDFHSDDRL